MRFRGRTAKACRQATMAGERRFTTMRVIAGEHRGANLAAPAGTRTRPITDQAKETLFNILGHRLGTLGGVPAVPVLDLFAGSGALGIECLSRGADSCVFVERDRDALRILRQNLEKLRLGPRARIASENAWTMRFPRPASGGYGLIFADPPYADVEARRVRDLLERLAPTLSQDGILVFRHGSATDYSQVLHAGLRCLDQRAFGRMHVLLFARHSPGPEAPAPEP